VKDNYHTEVDWNYLKSVQAHFSVQLFANEQTLAALGWKAGENSLAKLLKKIQTSRVRTTHKIVFCPQSTLLHMDGISVARQSAAGQFSA
jgi:hypothetical protein